MTAYDVAAKLPDIDLLRQRCKALAVLERIIDGGDPYYAYTSNWGTDEAALMSNSSGDEWAVVFTADGAFIRLFDHESAMSPYRNPDHELWPGLVDGVPEVSTSAGDGTRLLRRGRATPRDDGAVAAGGGRSLARR